MSSQKQIDANRQNAQNSHGPTTPEGQKRSSLNSIKHGWTGQTLVLSPRAAIVARTQSRPRTEVLGRGKLLHVCSRLRQHVGRAPVLYARYGLQQPPLLFQARRPDLLFEPKTKTCMPRTQ